MLGVGDETVALERMRERDIRIDARRKGSGMNAAPAGAAASIAAPNTVPGTASRIGHPPVLFLSACAQLYRGSRNRKFHYRGCSTGIRGGGFRSVQELPGYRRMFATETHTQRRALVAVENAYRCYGS